MKTLLTTLALISALAGCGDDRPHKSQATSPTATAALTQAQADQQLLRAAASGGLDATYTALEAGAINASAYDWVLRDERESVEELESKIAGLAVSLLA